MYFPGETLNSTQEKTQEKDRSSPKVYNDITQVDKTAIVLVTSKAVEKYAPVHTVNLISLKEMAVYH